MSQTARHVSTSIINPASTTRVVTFIALAYALLGMPGLMLATTSGYASPVFPAAGLALACVLRFGRLALPGIWLGAVAVNILPACLNNTLGLATAALAFFIAIGATIQAWAGCWLVNRLLGPARRDLKNESDALWFLFYGGVLAGVISSSLGVTGLYAVGLTELNVFFFTWWNWYVGDVLGIFVFAPLTLCLLNVTDELWIERRRRIILPMLFTLGLAASAFYGTTYWEKQVQDDHIRDNGLAIARRITDRLISHREILSSLQHFIEVTPELSFRKYEQFTSITLQDNPDIFALTFSNLITNAQRPSFERIMSRLSPLGPFQITEQDREKRLVRAAMRPEYVAIRYIVPLAGNQSAVGYDIYSEPTRRAAINRARASKRIAVTSPIHLVQEQKDRIGILELLPVDVPKAGNNFKEGRSLGFIAAVVKIDEMIDNATRGYVPPGLVFQLTDYRVPEGQNMLYRSDVQGAGDKHFDRIANWKTALSMGDRNWGLEVFITKDYRHQHQLWASWTVGFVGLIFAALLQILLLGMTGRTAIIRGKNKEISDMAKSLEEKVIERTAQLSKTNDKLSREIDEHKTAEEALKEREGKINAILQSTVDGIISIAENNIIENFNPAAEKIFGYAAAEVVGKNVNILMPEPDHSCHDQYIANYLKTGIKKLIGVCKETMGRRKDGTLFQAELAVSEVIVGDKRLFTALIRDVTERKRAEEANLRLASIVESSGDAIIGKTLDGIITSWNHGAERIYGYTAAEIAGHHISLLIPPDKTDELNEIIEQLRQGQRIEQIETVRLRKNGEAIDVSLTISPIKDAEDRIIGVSSIARDITRQKHTENELRKLSRAVEESPASVMITDIQGRINYVNPKFTRLTGYNPEEVIGKNPHILKSGETTPEDYKELWNTITSGGEWRGIFHNRKKNGELYWESASISPINDEHGVITNFIAVKEDITAIKEAQDELAKLSLVASKTDNAVIITDSDGLVEWVNDGFIQMTGYTLAEMLGKKPGTILQGPLSDPEIVERISVQLKKKEHFAEEIVNYHKNGKPYWVSMDITPIRNERGEVVRFISIQRDTTQRKEIEKALRQAKEAADAANRTKSDFLASMSHEIRTPMNAIIGMADLLWDSSLTEEQRRYVQIFRSAGEHLLSLINDILDLSKIEAGQMTLQSIPFSLPDLMKSIVDIMTIKATEKKLTLSCTIAPDTGNGFVGDPDRLRQILINLIGNALKFTVAGSVSITVEREKSIDSGAITPSDTIGLLFAVRDTGIGIPQDKLETIFDKFTRVDSSLSRQFGGTGLGLAISRQLVVQMGGTLQVESTEGSGSTFYFTVNLKKNEQAGLSEKAPTSAKETASVEAGPPLRILLVEDNEDNRFLILSYLKKLPHTVDIAVNGLEAVEKIQGGGLYDIILMDVQMPVMDGYTATRHIREWETQHNFKPAFIVALTAHALQEDEQKSVDAGCDAHLTKPIKKQEFLASLQRFTDRIRS